MIETNKGPESTEHADPVETEALQRRVVQLEQALADYIERYGLTDKAREAFRDPKC